MNFSTNQVLQLYVLDTSSAPTKVETAGGLQYVITHADGKVETTDLIKNIISLGAVKSGNTDVTPLKAAQLLVASPNAVAGQEYVVSLVIRDFSQENVTTKTCGFKATSAMVSSGSPTTSFYLELAKQLVINSGNGPDPLYRVFTTTDGSTFTEITKATVGSLAATDFSTTYGVYVAEPTPYWKLGSFPETVAEITIGVSPIWVSGTEVTDWLTRDAATGKGIFIDAATIDSDLGTAVGTLANTHRLADLEYFAKGERGNSNALYGWPDNIVPDLYVDSADTTGYSILNVVCAFVGNNDENQKSEKEIVFITKYANESNLSTIRTAIALLDTIV